MLLPGDNVKLKLRRVIARFKFDELEVAVLPSFPELTRKKLRSSLIKLHQNFTVSASVRVIMQSIKDAGIRDKELRDRLSTLELMEVSRHSSRRVWTCHEMRGAKSNYVFKSDVEIQERIFDAFKMNLKQMDVRVTSHDGITFVSVKDPKAGSRGKKKVYPTFFAFVNGQKYFFTSKKSVTKEFLLVMSNGLGYTDFEPAKLSGRDLKSLTKLLSVKKQGAINNENILKPPVYTGSKPVVRRTGIDFTQSKQRGEFVDKVFGTNPPSTELLEVNAANQTWKCSELVPEMKDEPIEFRLEFHSHHIPGMIKQLVERRVMQPPLPVYAEDMLKIGKNETTVRSLEKVE